ncbi:alpha/beta hydrolase [Thomasclavelia sp.]|uniref:alpha/beta hydrolase n=1 Tax=Thomasclavelia sp. TaxID=3025757 RepID=UPI0025F2B715|nr:alpha/beta hydrolase [Thomasclavelia sp.]
MKIKVANYTYETMIEYDKDVPGAKYIEMTGEEIGVKYLPDVIYDHRDGIDLHLQIIMPSIFNQPDKIFPAVVFIQGSAWKKQDVYQNVVNLGLLARKGYVCAIVEYRHSGIAHFPAQIIDGKNAIRYLKKHHQDYHLDPDKVIIMGDSSGGHTSAMIGMSAKSALFDDPINEQNCHVLGIIDLYGAVDVTMSDGFPSTLNHQLPDSPEGMLMGYNIRENMEKAREANAKTYVDLDFPPMLILHGTKDKTVFCKESVELYQALIKANKDATLYLVSKSDHGGAAFWKDQTIEIYDQFIQKCLRR